MKIKKFSNIREFAKERKLNRIIYRTMNYKEIRELKNYIYALNEKTSRKDLMWEYLNEPMDTEYFVSISIILGGYARNDKDSN